MRTKDRVTRLELLMGIREDVPKEWGITADVVRAYRDKHGVGMMEAHRAIIKNYSGVPYKGEVSNGH